MPMTTAQKFKIKDGDTLYVINAPATFKMVLSAPASVKTTNAPEGFQQIHWFVKDKAQLEKDMKKVAWYIKDSVICWIYYPKGTSGIKTDLNRDRLFDLLNKDEKLQFLSLVSFDDTWSAFGLRLKTGQNDKKAIKTRENTISSYIDPEKRTIVLPEDFGKILKKAKAEKEYFDSLSFTNKREYVEWIVSAKKEETRAKRLKESLERLGKKWKNPSNR
jgi:hypothetical protein